MTADTAACAIMDIVAPKPIIGGLLALFGSRPPGVSARKMRAGRLTALLGLGILGYGLYLVVISINHGDSYLSFASALGDFTVAGGAVLITMARYLTGQEHDD